MTPITGDEPINPVMWEKGKDEAGTPIITADKQGITLRQYFASRNMSGILSTLSGSTSITDTMADNIAKESVLCAKALIKALNEQPLSNITN